MQKVLNCTVMWLVLLYSHAIWFHHIVCGLIHFSYGLSSILLNTVKCHYNACHYNANASLTRSILGSQTAPSWPSPSSSAHGLKVWNHHCLIGHSGNDTPLFPYKWNKTKVSHLLVMSIQSIHHWSSIKRTDYSSPVLRECHHQANMAARCPDVENNPGSNQVNIRYTQ